MQRSGVSKAPLMAGLKKSAEEGSIPFHVPGHKKGVGAWPPWWEFLGGAVFSADLTEIPGLDDLHRPAGIIAEAQRLAAACFGADYSFFLVNGVTVGIQAMLMAACRPGDLVLVPRHAHRSLWGGLVLSGLKPVYLQSEVHPAGFAVGVKPVTVLEALNQYPEAKALFLVHPTYYGTTSAFPEVIKAAQDRGLVVLADEAHGAHFRFHPDLPASALSLGANLTAQGTHKLLGSFTQSAMLHVKNRQQLVDRVKKTLQLLQSTSPSYLLMASLDTARCQVEEKGRELIESLLLKVTGLRRRIDGLEGIRCYGPELKKMEGVADWDPTKLIIEVKGTGLSGFQAADYLRSDHGIVVEMAGPGYLLAVTSYADGKKEMEHLYRAVSALAKRYKGKREGLENLFNVKLPPLPPVCLSPREAFYKEGRFVPLTRAAGEITAEMVVPYPPGIPVVCPGEKITVEVLAFMREWSRLGGYFHGPSDPELKTIKVI